MVNVVEISDFYPHNFLDQNNFYFQCPKCGFKTCKSVRSFITRNNALHYRMYCASCTRPIYFDINAICLTFVIKYLPEHPIIEEITVGKHYVNVSAASRTVRIEAFKVFSKHVELVNMMESL